MMSGRFVHIPDEVVRRYRGFAQDLPSVVSPHHVLQKLIIFDFVAPIVAAHPHGEILEIGCGQGIHSAMLSRYGNVSATELATPGSFVGADRDVDRDRYAVFRSLAERPITFAYNDGRRMPYPDRAFDIVFHNSVIEHVPDVQAFNREVNRILKPGGICICITGTPALCRLRFVRDYLVKLPITVTLALAREIVPASWLRRFADAVLGRMGVAEGTRQKAGDRLLRVNEIARRVGRGSQPGTGEVPCSGMDFRAQYSRLFHYLYHPEYNRIIVEQMAEAYGIPVAALLACLQVHFASRCNRLRFSLTPVTHGQHYRNVRHEMKEWRVDRWKEHFSKTGFSVEDARGYRYHHLLEITPRASWDVALYQCAAKWIHAALDRRLANPSFASEIILVAKKNP